MTAPDGEEIGVFVVLAEVEVVEEISLHKGGVFESGKLEISGVGFGRREKIVFGLLGNSAIGDDKKSNGKEPEEVRNDEGKKGEKGGLEVLGFVFLLL
ncbi:MAG: hypothetical protein UV28_C0003G0003 [Candidatus Collierbacteria bacterium GW2011_GWE2_42_48]|nr:MAG: hypothetical protein UV28_C0003G0003 [Candidatus Collierbacteria bacterium GW2011_GWE2_42_48]KKS63452.1 MAG: hypothetical protein UV29_C0001G0009 [Candidatus Collierbacteria bacterium GW2011_GWD2_42_50]KKS64527.1 MAG: hypothetical protein UV32_C0012G0011 [Candidatus Collierbacteria bacterium GW2011_GWF2_42_51]